MADVTPATALTRPGQANNVGGSHANDTANFLKLFGGEVFTAFEQETKLLTRFRTRTITQGKSATFPVMGRASAKYHQLGDNILTDEDTGGTDYLQSIGVNERVIGIDRALIAPTFIAEWDEFVNHFDVRGPTATELGRALAFQMDKNIYRTCVRAARTAANITGLPGGTTGTGSFTSATMRTSASDMVTALFAAAQKFDENSVPKEGRIFLCTPAQYYLLAQQKDLVDRDYSASNGDYAMGKVLYVAGIEIVPNISSSVADETALSPFADANGVSPSNDYSHDLTQHAGLVLHRDAVGTLKLRDLTVQSEYKIEYQGTLMVAKYMAGHGVLRPECAIELLDT